MRYRPIVVTLLVTMLAGCAYPGHSGLMKDAHQIQYTYDGAMRDLADCLTEKFNNEPFGVWDINTPVTANLVRGNSMQLVSSANNVWQWSILLSPAQDGGTDVKADIRKSVNPYLSNTYMLEKVEGYLGQCGGSPA